MSEIVITLSNISNRGDNTTVSLICEPHDYLVPKLACAILDYDSQIVQRSSSEQSLINSALLLVGNCVSVENPAAIKAFIDAGLLYKLRDFLHSESITRQKYACWIYSNVVCGKDCENIISLLFTQSMNSICIMAHYTLGPSIEVQKEALWFCCNLINCGTQM